MGESGVMCSGPVILKTEIETSGTLSLAKPGEPEQSEADCDTAEAPDADAPVEQPAFVSPPERYPTNKWIKLGTFHGRDERNVQSFPLDEQMYAKYVKMFIKYIK
ncbi:hypothetical protein A6R68_01548, partial [Neotoma lepida]